jgi:hypothetical protein
LDHQVVTTAKTKALASLATGFLSGEAVVPRCAESGLRTRPRVMWVKDATILGCLLRVIEMDLDDNPSSAGVFAA